MTYTAEDMFAPTPEPEDRPSPFAQYSCSDRMSATLPPWHFYEMTADVYFPALFSLIRRNLEKEDALASLTPTAGCGRSGCDDTATPDSSSFSGQKAAEYLEVLSVPCVCLPMNIVAKWKTRAPNKEGSLMAKRRRLLEPVVEWLLA
ncbi:hypothetical protein Dda_6980 [Drechslerella dactyloides]|uniref:Uncharacterized protein n=1 Tax=Drechslerella dactyloides TaxID=74499 RepID=A0AAD6NH81_DREDA|nr:hypothetical protein Dda_6980 [Drechslerella dactyloides]